MCGEKRGRPHPIGELCFRIHRQLRLTVERRILTPTDHLIRSDVYRTSGSSSFRIQSEWRVACAGAQMPVDEICNITIFVFGLCRCSRLITRPEFSQMMQTLTAYHQCVRKLDIPTLTHLALIDGEIEKPLYSCGQQGARIEEI
jgi:hypothetical protein